MFTVSQLLTDSSGRSAVSDEGVYIALASTEQFYVPVNLMLNKMPDKQFFTDLP